MSSICLKLKLQIMSLGNAFANTQCWLSLFGEPHRMTEMDRREEADRRTTTGLHFLPVRYFFMDKCQRDCAVNSVCPLAACHHLKTDPRSVCVMRMKSISQLPAARAVRVSFQKRGGNYGTCCVEGKPGHRGGIKTANPYCLPSLWLLYPLDLHCTTWKLTLLSCHNNL